MEIKKKGKGLVFVFFQALGLPIEAVRGRETRKRRKEERGVSGYQDDDSQFFRDFQAEEGGGNPGRLLAWGLNLWRAVSVEECFRNMLEEIASNG